MSNAWQEVDELFERVSQVPQDERQDWLDNNCNDARQRAQVDRLLRYDDTEFLEESTGSFGSSEKDLLAPGGALAGPLWEKVEEDLNQGDGPSAGDLLGPYEIKGILGAGGMGRVYRAHHPDLGRLVAIKTLPEELRADPEFLKRFQQEARVLAQLNHPNVAMVHDLLIEQGHPYLVLELVEGETLARVLDQRSLSVREALGLAEQIAAGLEEAHLKGVIHRDLKPSNIMVRPDGQLKILDFGLAKAEVRSGSLTRSQETLIPVTRTGTVMGTTAYMSPEQASGDPVDRRTDVWSFGCVLFELLTGDRAFGRDSQPETLGALLRDDPEWLKLPKEIPAPVVALLTRCLRKDPSRRLRDIGDARLVLQDVAEDESTVSLWPGTGAKVAASDSPVRVVMTTLPWVLFVGLGLWLLFSRIGEEPPDLGSQTRQLEVGLPSELELSPSYYPAFSLSPDGQEVVFVARDGDIEQLWHQSLDRLEAKLLPATEGAELPVFSPDGDWVAFAQDGRIRKLQLGEDASIEVTAAGGSSRGFDWTSDGGFVYAPNQTSGLSIVDKLGRESTALTELEPSRDEKSHRWPQAIRNTDLVLYTVQYEGASFEDASLEVVDISTGARTKILDRAAYGRVTSRGELIYAHGGRLYRGKLDLKRLEVLGTPEAVFDGVSYDPRNGGTQVSLAENGALAYSPSSPLSRARDLVWYSQDGQRRVISSEPREFREPSVSPDGSIVAFGLGGAFEADLCVLDLNSGTLSQLTYDQSISRPIWSIDGRVITFAQRTEQGWALASLDVGGGGSPKPFYRSKSRIYPDGWLASGHILLDQLSEETGWDVLELDPVSGDVSAVLSSPANEARASLSVDSEWIGFESDEVDGYFEVYVQKRLGGRRVRVSRGGGRWPHFVGQRTLYYWSTAGPQSERVHRVEYTVENGRFEIESDTKVNLAKVPDRNIVVTPAWAGGFKVNPESGEILLLETDVPSVSQRRLVIATNW